MNQAGKVTLAVMLGASAFLIGALADGMLGAARSPTPPATFAIIGAYLAVGQFFVAARGATLRANMPTVIGMAAPGTAGVLLMLGAEEGRAVLLSQALPLLLASWLGPLLGAIVAGVSSGRSATRS